jgi:hypothetical protein
MAEAAHSQTLTASCDDHIPDRIERSEQSGPENAALAVEHALDLPWMRSLVLQNQGSPQEPVRYPDRVQRFAFLM